VAPTHRRRKLKCISHALYGRLLAMPWTGLSKRGKIVRIEIFPERNLFANRLTFGVLKASCQSYCDRHSIRVAIETVHTFRGTRDRLQAL